MLHPHRRRSAPPPRVPGSNFLQAPLPPRVALFLAPLLLLACGDDTSLNPPDGEEGGYELAFHVDEATLQQGDTLELEVFAVNEDDGSEDELDPSELVWASSDPAVAGVEEGRVFARNPGSTVVEAMDSDDQVAAAAIEVKSGEGSSDNGEENGEDDGDDDGDGDGHGADPRPNEPEGFEVMAESTKSGDSSEYIGSWQLWSGEENVEVVQDPDAPGSAGYQRYRYPEGHSPGTGPVGESGWSEGWEEETDELYFSMWYRLADPGSGDWESQSTMTKQGFFGVGSCSGANNDGFFAIEGGTREAFDLRFYQQNVVARHLSPQRGNVIQVGEWHHIEMYAGVNDIGQDNGTLRVWVDGELTISYDDVMWRTSSNSCGFQRWVWNPTWGGMGGGDKSRDDFVDLSHVYMSRPVN